MAYILPLGNSAQYWDARARQVASNYGLDPDFFSTLIGSESAWKTYNPSGTGPIGIGQFTRDTASQYGVIRGNAESELDGAARYMRDLLQRKGNWQDAIYTYKGRDYNAAHKIAAESSWQKILATVTALKGGVSNAMNLASTGGAGQTDAQNPQAAQGEESQGLSVDWAKWATFFVVLILVYFGIQQIVRG